MSGIGDTKQCNNLDSYSMVIQPTARIELSVERKEL